jgi:hypothetical protein
VGWGKKIKQKRLDEWEEVYKNPDVNVLGKLDDRRALHGVYVVEDISAQAKQGFMLPPPDQWGEWVQSNMGCIEERAKAGDEVMQALVAEVKNGLSKGSVGESKRWGFTPICKRSSW